MRPAAPRDAARMLVVRPPHGTEDLQVRDLPSLLRAGDLLVVNDTRVIPARLKGVRRRKDAQEVRLELMLHRPLPEPGRWSAFARPAKRLQPHDALFFGELSARVIGRRDGGEVEVAFDAEGAALQALIDREGETPLPPYIAGKRAADAQDRADYQTVYAEEPGSVAAPTAGLHFTPGLLASLEAMGVSAAHVTLHVGAGTFLPVKADRIEDHRMHAEFGEVSERAAEQINDARAAGGRVICVGTTSLRLLESAARNGRVQAFRGETDIFIRPGGRAISTADALLTNFHLPRSTLLMLVAAFSGLDTMKQAYVHALASGYRFYSYGDTGLWWRA